MRATARIAVALALGVSAVMLKRRRERHRRDARMWAEATDAPTWAPTQEATA